MINTLFIISLFTIDRISKLIIIGLSEPSGELNISVTTFLNFNLIWNEGIAFGLFSFDEKIYYNLLTLVIIIITIIIIFFMLKTKGYEKKGFLLIIGGSFGNIFDRVYYSSVPDFIDIYFNNYHWFIFNVADIFITSGVILLISLEIFSKKRA